MLVTDDSDAGTRYLLLDTLREYAWEHLDELDDASRVHARHAEHFLALVEIAADQLKGPESDEWCFRLDAERDNLRAALGWVRDHDGPETLIRLVQGLEVYWYITGLLREVYQWNRAAVEHATDMPTEVRAGLLAFAGRGPRAAGRTASASSRRASSCAERAFNAPETRGNPRYPLRSSPSR